MNRLSAICVLILSTAFFVSCSRSSGTTADLLADWESDGSASALEEINLRYSMPKKDVASDSVLAVYSRIFRNFPSRASGSGMTDAVGKAFIRYFNAAYYSPDSDRRLGEFLQITDSLAGLKDSWLATECRYYLAAYRIYVNSVLGRSDTAFIRDVMKYPVSSDASQEAAFGHIIAEAMCFSGMSSGDYLAMQERAVDAVRRGGDVVDPVDVLSQAGMLYNRNGEYEKGALYLQEAVEYVRSHPEAVDKGVVKLYGNLSNLYSRLGMYEKSLELNSEAIELGKDKAPELVCDLKRMRATVYSLAGELDSADFMLKKALEWSRSLRDSATVALYARAIESERMWHYIEHADKYADSLGVAVDMLRRMPDDSHRGTTNRFMLGLALAQSGKAAEGIPLMESATAEFERQRYGESVTFAYEWLVKMYAANGMSGKLGAVMPRYLAMCDSMKHEDQVNGAIAANIRYETGRQEEENKALANEVKMKRHSLTLVIVALVLAVCLLIAGVMLYIQYRRSTLRERKLYERQIEGLLSSQQALNRRAEELSEELKQASGNEVVDNVLLKLEPTLISEANERNFRQAFNLRYPSYLKRLRETGVNLTKSDELFCMLIFLEQSSDEIALALGIMRASVNSARYRLRRKFGLDPTVELDAFLKSDRFYPPPRNK